MSNQTNSDKSRSSVDPLGDRMKEYESAYRAVLPRRLPVIVRIDGKAFHTYTEGCSRPFDPHLGDVMVRTTAAVCQTIQGAQLAYVQSDEISILIHGYKRFVSSPWFGNEVQKIVSVAASTAAAHFTAESWRIWVDETGDSSAKVGGIRPAAFDARVFVLPEAEVCNYFLWRQRDAMRNSVSMLAQSLFSPKQCERKSTRDLMEMCATEGQDWNSLPPQWQRGVCVIRRLFESPEGGIRSKWEADPTYPIFSENRSYVDQLLAVEES